MEDNIAEQRRVRIFLMAQRLSWRTFWAKRAPWRINLVKLSLVSALLIGIYLFIPNDWRSEVNQWLLAAFQFVISFSPLELLAGVAVLLILVSLYLVFVRSYHRATYLATTPSAIPLISVYVDAENQLSRAEDIPKFADEIIRHLNGRRADLLFFMDSSSQEHGAQTEQFNLLCRYGFHPVHVPHNPTGEAKRGVKEAVDKELAMHAYERALLGPQNQEFIIVTSDQDFVALVYRLAALGHRVKVWATPILPAYRALSTYLDVELNDIARLVSESGSSDQETASGRHESHEERTLLSEAGERQIYRAIMETLEARNDCERQHKNLAMFRGILGAELSSRLAGVGYGTTSKIDYWLDHLDTTGVLKRTQADRLPAIGSTFPENAAHAMFVVAQITAESAIAMRQQREKGIVTLNDVANALLARRAQARGHVRSLLELFGQKNHKRETHARYFVRCAQALGLIEFDEEKNRQHVILSPRLPQTLVSDESHDNGQPSETPNGKPGDATAGASNVTTLPVTLPENTDAQADGVSGSDPGLVV